MNREKLKKPDGLMIAEIVVFTGIFLLELLAVPMSDDYRYAVNEGFLDIFRREYIQYMTWTGRSVAHILARIFLALPRGVFAAANSACYVYVCRLLQKHAQKNDERNTVLFLITALMIFVFAPVFGQSVIWETGACNYLWTAAIVFTFLGLYRREEGKRFLPVMFLFGIAAGWTNENTGGAMILWVVLYMLYRAVRKEKNPGWMYAGLAGAVIGFVLMIKAPGNAVRALDFVHTGGRAYELMHDFFGFITVIKDEMGLLFILFAVCASLSASCTEDRSETCMQILYALCGTAAVFAIILSPVPVVYDRSMFGASLFVITGIVCALYGMQHDRLLKNCTSAFCTVLAVFSVMLYMQGAAGMTYTRYLYEQREDYVRVQKEAGNMNPVIPLLHNEFITDMDPLLAGDISHYRHFWVNETYAWHHGLESVQAVDPEKWRLIYEHGDPALMNITDLREYLERLETYDHAVVLVNTTVLDERFDGHVRLLAEYGLIPEDHDRVFSVIRDGETIAYSSAENGSWCEEMHAGHYFWLQGGEDPVYSDIAVDGTEYSIDNSGITIVVYDPAEGRVLDSVSWVAESDQGGIRFRKD